MWRFTFPGCPRRSSDCLAMLQSVERTTNIYHTPHDSLPRHIGYVGLTLTHPDMFVLMTSSASFVGVIVHYCLLLLSCRNIIKWCNYAYGFSLATVAIANFMTAGRIWYVLYIIPYFKSYWFCLRYTARRNNQVFQQATSSHRLTVLLIVESGAIVFAEQIVEFTLCRLNNPPDMGMTSNFNAYFVLHLMAPQIMVRYWNPSYYLFFNDILSPRASRMLWLLPLLWPVSRVRLRLMRFKQQCRPMECTMEG